MIAPMPEPGPLLHIEHLSKTFPGQRALDGMHLDVRPREVHALVGPNGSGKSTLIKVLAGFHQPDPDPVASWGGEPFDLGAPADADGRLRFVHQDLGLVAELNAIDNVALVRGYGRRTPVGTIHWRDQSARVTGLLARLGVELDVFKPVGQCTPVERASIAIARALEGLEPSSGLLVLDEPTAALPPVEVRKLFDIVRELVASGMSVLYVSHRLDEIFDIADRVTVIREGRHVATRDVADLAPKELASLLVGHAVDDVVRHERTDALRDAPPALTVDGLASAFVDDLSFAVGRGEILGFAGILGSGREEIPYAVAGALSPPAGGVFHVAGRRATGLDPLAAMELGIAFVPADRAAEGSLADFTVGENITLPTIGRHVRAGRISHRRELAAVRDWIARVEVVPPVPARPFPTLSGGNQQKAIVAKALALEPVVLVLSEPTAGVDVGARSVLYELIRREARDGLGVVVSSSDVEDLVNLCDRVIVLRDGRAVRELGAGEISQASLLHAMEGTEGAAEPNEQGDRIG